MNTFFNSIERLSVVEIASMTLFYGFTILTVAIMIKILINIIKEIINDLRKQTIQKNRLKLAPKQEVMSNLTNMGASFGLLIGFVLLICYLAQKFQ